MIRKFTQHLSNGVSLYMTKWFMAVALPFLVSQAAQAQLNYVPTACNDPYVQVQGQAGTTFLGQGDDVIFANVALPFPFLHYTTSYTTVNIGTNGFVVFLPGTNRGLGNAALPTAIAGACLYPFWDDLDINQATAPNAGVYTRVDGVAPNRIFTIEWFNAGHFPDAANQTITFQVRLFENGNRIQYKYFDTVFGGTQAGFDNGLSATVGMEGPLPAPRPFTQVGANQASVTSGQCIEFVVPQACNVIPGPTVTLGTAPGTCLGAGNVAIPSFNPAGCADGITTGLRYRIDNTGPFITVPLPTASIAVAGLSSGVHTITWQTFIIANGATAGQANQTIIVQDSQPPTITCPANIVINLPPGACEQIVTYNVTATDNCPLVVNQAAWAVDTSAPLLVNSSLSCGPGVIQNDYFQVLTLPAGAFASGFNATYARIGVNSAYTIGATFTVRIHRLINPATPYNVTAANRQLLGASAPVALGPGLGGGNINIPVSANIPAGSTVLLQVTSSHPYSVGNQAGAGNQTWLGSAPCGISPDNPSTFISLGNFPQEMAAVLYGLVAAPPPAQTAGLPSGSSFPIGVTTNCFVATDVAGNTSTCCFTVTVLEFPNPIQSLVCNDLVQVSLDENCTAIIGADQVLEGGPYGCYDDYIVELDKTAPFGNGPWVPAVLGPGDVGKTYQVRVTDPDTGNKCWGNIKVEDKLPPVLECEPYTLYCNTSLVPCEGDGPPISSTVQFPATTLPHGGGAITVAGNLLPGGFFFNLRNDGPEDLIITGYKVRFGTSTFGAVPSPQTVNTYFTTTANTYVGNQAIAANWTSSGVASVTVAGPNSEYSQVTLSNPFVLTVGQQKGIFLFGVNASLVYNGAAQSSAAPITMAPLTLTPGMATGTLFTASALTPRTPNVQVQFAPVNQVSPCLPNGLELGVNVFPSGTPGCYTVTQGAGDPVLEPCSDASLCYIDTEVDQNCASGLTKIVNRKWTATDASGNTATCIQVIRLLRPTLFDVDLPPNYDDIDEPALECTSPTYPSPDYLESIGLQGYPYVFGQPDGCSINWTYEDAVVKVCDGTIKVLREWKVIDWCTGGLVTHNQIIKVLDDAGPAMVCPANITVGTDPFTCCATADLPDLIIEDNCSRIKSVSAMIQTFDAQTNQQLNMYQFNGSVGDFPGNNWWDLDTLGVFGYTPCLPLGSHLVTYMAEDDCGNTSTCTFRIIVRDYTPPVAACDEFTVVGIGVDDPFDCYGPAGPPGIGPDALDACEFAGVTWVKASTFDDGSYDNCGDIKLTIRRMGPYSECINALNGTNGQPACDDFFPDFPNEFERAISEGDSIKFYCCEVGTTQTVILKVYQLDVFGNIVVGPDGTPVANECMVQVEVQDKIKPICQSPANVTVNCENFDPSLWAYGKATVYDNCCLDTAQVYQGQCGLSHTANYSLFDTVCNKGTITRTFRAFDCHGLSGQCTQRVVVTYEQDYYVRFPNDVIVSVCDGTGNYGEPTFFGEDCELLGVSHEDEIFTVVPDACYKIERTWTIINWCTYNPNLGCINVPNPNPNAIVNHPSNLPGPTVSACGTPAPWAPTVVRINPTDPQPTNYCTFWDANANCYKYKQIIKVIDTQAPTVDCPASPVEFCDVTPNDPLLWNAMYWWDNSIQSHDLCEGPADLCITATDLCSGANINISYLLFLDLDGDGTMETVINSNNTGIAGLGWNAVPYGNANNPNYTGGTIRAFDGRPVLPNQKYGFALQTTTSGTNKTACVRWNTQQSQNTYVIPELPYGTHKIKWFISDGCGNNKECEYTFVVKDCKAPTVVCINGLSVNIMPTQMIQLWASDFLQYTEDNCTPANLIKIGIRRSGTGTGFPFEADGVTPQTGVTFTCDDLGTQLVELWGMDVAGNADYCETYVIVQDNAGNCNNNFGSVAGTLKTELNSGLEDAKVDLNGSHPALPPVSMFEMTDINGAYNFDAVPILGDYTLTPNKDNDPLNGVSTFDLVLINKHILGLEPLNSPYKMIAADANNSRSITTFDIVELRKLILGIYTDLPNNTSWRFVDKAYAFPNPANPFATIFPETKQIADMQASMDAENFVAVKTGDVNGNALTNILQTAEDRTAGTLLFDVDDRQVKAGETFTVNFKASEKVLGYQFTMNFPNLEVVEIADGVVKSENFGVFAAEKALTTSWNGDAQAEFAVTFRAKANGTLSQMLGVSSRITKAEAYTVEGERLQVAFRFNGQNGSTIAGLGFELYQNTPNPFINKTQIGFYLPEATEATLTIFDETGRTLFTQKGDFGKGYNAVTIDRAVLNTTGLLYYKLETATNSATRKMIQTK